jgi:hypothetical protein
MKAILMVGRHVVAHLPHILVALEMGIVAAATTLSQEIDGDIGKSVQELHRMRFEKVL